MPIPFDPDIHCGAKRKSDDLKGPGKAGDPCRKTKGWGTTHNGDGKCKLHGGNTPLAIVGAERREQTAKVERMLERMGIAVETDPQSALLGVVYESAGNVAFLREKVHELGADGLVGEVRAIAQRESVTLQVSEEVRAIVRLYGDWVDRLAKFSKLAIDAGIAERQVKLAEAQGYAIRDLINAVLDGMAVTPEQRTVGLEIAQTKLRLLAG